MRRGAVLFRFSRIACSSIATSTRLSARGDADASDEVADRGRRYAAAAQAGERRHARIVPAVNVALATSWVSTRLDSTV